MSHKGCNIRRKQNHREYTLPVKDICDSFPNVELCYETIIHKKVYDADFCLLVPEGTKTFVWFTTMRNQNVCLSMTIGEKNKYKMSVLSTRLLIANLRMVQFFMAPLFDITNLLHFQ